MEPQAYSAFADLLNKFHTSSEAIQALWLVAVPVTVLGVAWCLTQALRDVAVALIDRRSIARGQVVHGIHEMPDGRIMLDLRGAVRELSREDTRGGYPVALERDAPPGTRWERD
ncbi:hypothetical protein [Microvirga subterranea]|uniref:Uncharacterized protein n=1 Tax=Microvirga subterranea TaxID=186651 RepID=A0A370HIU3_9HYPH|nr:hypothetical protein [Microvirga subterranea]RDI58054.1 hypothetical protein DES45_106368 [Microvirga subterranea]